MAALYNSVRVYSTDNAGPDDFYTRVEQAVEKVTATRRPTRTIVEGKALVPHFMLAQKKTILGAKSAAGIHKSMKYWMQLHAPTAEMPNYKGMDVDSARATAVEYLDTF